MTLTDALRVFRDRGIGLPWGMLWIRATDDARVRGGDSDVDLFNLISPPGASEGWQPSLVDPATVGCLLSLLREASEPTTYVAPVSDHWECYCGAEVHLAATEGEAIAAALVAVAEAL